MFLSILRLIMSILRHTDLDLKKINYKKPEKQGLVYYSGIDYNNEPFYLQTPKMICKKNGLEILESKNNTLEIQTMNTDFAFYDSLVNLDELNVKKTFENNKEWFGKGIPLEVIDNMYKRTNKPVKKNSKPIFWFKMPFIKDKIQCQVYDQKKNCLDFKTIKEGSEVICILHIKGLKFLKQHYYCDIYISQVKVFVEGDLKYNILESYAFDDKEEEEHELRYLEQDLMLDEDFLNSISTNKEERLRLEKELSEAKELLVKQGNIVKNLENRFNELN